MRCKQRADGTALVDTPVTAADVGWASVDMLTVLGAAKLHVLTWLDGRSKRSREYGFLAG